MTSGQDYPRVAGPSPALSSWTPCQTAGHTQSRTEQCRQRRREGRCPALSPGAVLPAKHVMFYLTDINWR